MAVHWGSVTANTGKYGAYINIYEVANSIDIANNTSRVTVDFHITRSNWGWQTSNSYSGNITIDGQVYNFSYSPNWSYSSSGDVIIASFTATVKHNDDGAKWCDASANWWTSGTYSCGIASASGGVSLSTIPRASGIACSSPYIGDVATITIDTKSSLFTNTVTYNIGGITGTIAEKTTQTVLSLSTSDIAEEIYALIPNTKQIQGTVYCTTYNGNTQIGSTTSANFNLYANESDVKPDVSGQIIDTNPTTIALTGSENIIVKYASIPKVTITATPKKSATIQSYNINANDGQQVNLQEYTFANGIGSNIVTINAIDSRGFGNPQNLQPNVIDYIPIIINTFIGDRPEDVSNEVILNAGGVWFNGEFKEGTANTLSCSFWYRESGSDEWLEGGIITPTIQDNTFRFENYSLGNLFDYEKQWQIKIRVQDLTGYAERDDLNISKGQEVVAIGDDKVWVNGELDINGDIKQNGESIAYPNAGKMIWLYPTQNQWIPATTQVELEWQATHFNNANGALTKEGNGVLIGENVKCVHVNATYRIYGNEMFIYLFKNSELIAAANTTQAIGGQIHINNVISVEAGDVITVRAYLQYEGSTVGDGSPAWSYFKVTVIA